MSERSYLLKIRNTNKKQFTISKINLVLKNIIPEWEPDLTSLKRLVYVSVVISTELCGVKLKHPKKCSSKMYLA